MTPSFTVRRGWSSLSSMFMGEIGRCSVLRARETVSCDVTSDSVGEQLRPVGQRRELEGDSIVPRGTIESADDAAPLRTSGDVPPHRLDAAAQRGSCRRRPEPRIHFRRIYGAAPDSSPCPRVLNSATAGRLVPAAHSRREPLRAEETAVRIRLPLLACRTAWQSRRRRNRPVPDPSPVLPHGPKGAPPSSQHQDLHQTEPLSLPREIGCACWRNRAG